MPSSCFHVYWIKLLLIQNPQRDIVFSTLCMAKTNQKGLVNGILMSHHHPSPQMAFYSHDQLQFLLGAHSPNLSYDKSHMSYFLSYRFLSPISELLEPESPEVGLSNL